jgi:hypothetical protein
MNTTYELYLHNARRPHDISEHLPILLGLAVSCEHVVELGFRSGRSTSAFLAAGAKVTAYDTQPCATEAAVIKSLGGKKFTFIQGNSLEVEIPQCDMLFIDTYHTGEQLLAELMRHHEFVDKWIAMHDTVTFGERGEDGKPGLVWALQQFQKHAPHWPIKLHLPHNNGLTILESATRSFPRRMWTT